MTITHSHVFNGLLLHWTVFWFSISFLKPLCIITLRHPNWPLTSCMEPLTSIKRTSRVLLVCTKGSPAFCLCSLRVFSVIFHRFQLSSCSPKQKICLTTTRSRRACGIWCILGCFSPSKTKKMRWIKSSKSTEQLSLMEISILRFIYVSMR